MLASILKIVLFALIALAVWGGVRRIWRDWTKQFRDEEKAIHTRDVEERARPDVVTLKRDKDGTFRAPDDKGR